MRNSLLRTAVMTACALAATAALADDAPQEKTTVGGKAFIDFTNIDAKVNGTKQDSSGYGLDVKRFYVGIDHTFDDVWAADVTTDFNYISADSETQVYIKKAYLQAKINDAFVLRAGSADLPWVPFVEGLYGYRYVENVMIDRTGFGTSADWGLHASGKAADGIFNYAVSVVNGAGYKKLTRSKSMDFEGRVSIVPVKGLTFAVGYRSGKLGLETESNPAEETASRVDALVAYVNKSFRVGGEYFTAKNYSSSLVQQTAATPVTDKADGYSVWGSYNFTPMAGVFARYEQVKPSKDLNSSLKNKYLNVGFEFVPRKNVNLALVYKNTKLDSSASDAKTNEFGVWAQVAF